MDDGEFFLNWEIGIQWTNNCGTVLLFNIGSRSEKVSMSSTVHMYSTLHGTENNKRKENEREKR